jgi:hypothetical protein
MNGARSHYIKVIKKALNEHRLRCIFTLVTQKNPERLFRAFLVLVVTSCLLFSPKVALGHPDVVIPMPAPTEPEGQIPEIAVDNIPVESTPIETIVIDESGDSALLPPDDILFVPLIPEEPAPEVPAEPEPTPFVVVEGPSAGDVTVVVPLDPPLDAVLELPSPTIGPPGTVTLPPADDPDREKTIVPTPTLGVPGGGVAPPAGDPDRQKTIVPGTGPGPILDPRPPDDDTSPRPPEGSDEDYYYTDAPPPAQPAPSPRYEASGPHLGSKSMGLPEKSFTMPFRQLDYLPVEDRRKIEAALGYLERRSRKAGEERGESGLRRNLMDVKNAQVLVEYLNPEVLANLLNLPVGAVDTNFGILDSAQVMKALAASYAMAWPDNWSEGAVQPFVQMVVYRSFRDPNYIKAFLILRVKADAILQKVKAGQNAGTPVVLPASQPKTE